MEKLDVVGIAEIAEMVGVTRQRVDQLSRTDHSFPEPVAEIRAGRIWALKDVLAWMKSSGR